MSEHERRRWSPMLAVKLSPSACAGAASADAKARLQKRESGRMAGTSGLGKRGCGAATKCAGRLHGAWTGDRARGLPPTARTAAPTATPPLTASNAPAHTSRQGVPARVPREATAETSRPLTSHPKEDV